MEETTQAFLALARELHVPPEVLPPLAAAGEVLSWPDLPVAALSAPETAEKAWAQAMSRLPDWEADGGMAQLAVVLAAAGRTREAYRQAGISDDIFLNTMGCLPRFLRETKELTGQWAFDRGFWTWRQTGGVLFRLGELEYEYRLFGEEFCPKSQPGDPIVRVHIPSDAVLSRERLDASYADAWHFFSTEGAAFCGKGPPRAMTCHSWLLAPALDGLLPETSGIRRFAADYERSRVQEDDTSFYRWLFRVPEPIPTEALPEHTSLQRAVKVHLAAGGKLGAAWGTLREGI